MAELRAACSGRFGGLRMSDATASAVHAFVFAIAQDYHAHFGVPAPVEILSVDFDKALGRVTLHWKPTGQNMTTGFYL